MINTEQITNKWRGMMALSECFTSCNGTNESAAAVGGDLQGRLLDNRHADNELPLCVFGPGGKYRTAWLPGPILSRQNRDTRLTPVSLATAPTEGRLPAAVAAWWLRLAGLLKASQAEAKRWMRLRAADDRWISRSP